MSLVKPCVCNRSKYFHSWPNSSGGLTCCELRSLASPFLAARRRGVNGDR
jgi:hypothetical protein